MLKTYCVNRLLTGGPGGCCQDTQKNVFYGSLYLCREYIWSNIDQVAAEEFCGGRVECLQTLREPADSLQILREEDPRYAQAVELYAEGEGLEWAIEIKECDE